MTKNTYPAIFQQEDDGYVVTFPDLKGCVTEGDTMEDAYKYAKEVLALHLDGLKNAPAPSKVEDIELSANQSIMIVEADETDEVG